MSDKGDEAMSDRERTEDQRRERRREKDRRGNVACGLVVVTVGLIFLAERMDWGVSFHQLWPVILIVMGLGSLVTRTVDTVPQVHVGWMVGASDGMRRPRYRIGGGVWLVFVGVLLLLNQLHVVMMSKTWPLFIVAGGLALVASGRSRTRKARPSDSGSAQDGGSHELG